jgi:hypothetical protein
MSLRSLSSDGAGQHPDTTHITQQRGANQRSGVEPKNIPEELKARKQWAPWRYIERQGKAKPGKLPLRANNTSRIAKTNAPEHWGTFEKALEVLEKNPTFDGIGYFFDEEDLYVGFDLDGCFDPEAEELHEAAAEIVEDLGGYWEISPSGAGVKGVVRATKPGQRCSNGKRPTPWGGELAIYEKGRFFALTGRAVEGRTEIADAQKQVEEVYRRFIEEDRPQGPPPRQAPEAHGLSDDELIRRASGFKNGERFDALYHRGITAPHPSRSEADIELLGRLCFLTGGDVDRMVRMFTRSALYLPEEKGEGYVRRSATNAARGHSGGYYRPRPEGLDELVEALSAAWCGEEPKGLGRLGEARFVRFLIRKGAKVGEVIPEGLRVEASHLEISEALKVHPNTVINLVRRLKLKGTLRTDNAARKSGRSGAFVLFDPRRDCGNSTHTFGAPQRVSGDTTRVSRLTVAELRTRHHHLRDGVGYSGENIRCRMEADGGSRTAEEWRGILGWSRARDLRLRLDSMVDDGLLERREGRYGLPGAYGRAQERFWRTRPISTVQRRRVRHRTPEGRVVCEVRETGSVSTGEVRDLLARRRNEDRRAAYREALKRGRVERERCPEDDAEIVAVLNTLDEEREAATADELGPRDLVGWVEEAPPEPIPASPTVLLPDEEMADLEAILAYEAAHGSGSFGWDRASCKRLFYGGPVRGRWPDPETLARIKAAYDKFECVVA